MEERDEEMKERQAHYSETVAKDILFTARRLIEDLLLDSRYKALDTMLFLLVENEWVRDEILTKFAIFRDDLNALFSDLLSLFDLIQNAGTVVSLRLDQLTEQNTQEVEYILNAIRAARESLDRAMQSGIEVSEGEGDILSDAIERQSLIDDIAGAIHYNATPETERDKEPFEKGEQRVDEILDDYEEDDDEDYEEDDDDEDGNE